MKSPVLDIVIPVYNGYDLLKACLASVEAHTTQPYHVWIGDDCSRQTVLKEFYHTLDPKRYTVTINKNRRGFPGNCNDAVAKGSAPFICLLNSDTRVTKQWVEPSLDDLMEPKVGVVGCRCVYPREAADHGDTIQHAGVARNSQGLPYHIYRHSPKNAPEVNRRLQVNCVTFACAFIRRDTWNQLGGLDEQFRQGQFEDVDFCWKARAAGWDIIYEPKTLIYHHEHGSGEQEWAEAKNMQNRDLLMKRWGNQGSDEYLFAPTLKGYKPLLETVMEAILPKMTAIIDARIEQALILRGITAPEDDEDE